MPEERKPCPNKCIRGDVLSTNKSGDEYLMKCPIHGDEVWIQHGETGEWMGWANIGAYIDATTE